jgi:hypothetical protein
LFLLQPWVLKARKDHKALKVHKVLQEAKAPQAVRVLLVLKDHKGM